jgi:hypothetical protein
MQLGYSITTNQAAIIEAGKSLLGSGKQLRLRTPAPPCAPHHLHGVGIRKPSHEQTWSIAEKPPEGSSQT